MASPYWLNLASLAHFNIYLLHIALSAQYPKASGAWKPESNFGHPNAWQVRIGVDDGATITIAIRDVFQINIEFRTAVGDAVLMLIWCKKDPPSDFFSGVIPRNKGRYTKRLQDLMIRS